MLGSVTIRHLFPIAPTIRVASSKETCSCGGLLKVLKTKKRTISTLDIGTVEVIEVVTHCDQCHRSYFSEDLQLLVPQGCKFGFDILIYVGESLFIHHRRDLEIVADLQAKNVFISRREVGELGKKFITYLALAHKEKQPQLRDFFEKRGGYILHLDGTCDGDSPHLIGALDGIENIVLGSVKIPSEKTEQLIPFLEKLKAAYGRPLACVHDLSSAIIGAIEAVFKGVLDFICHFHFLRDIGKDLLNFEYTYLRDTLRAYNTRVLLRTFGKKLLAIIENDKNFSKDLRTYLQQQKTEQVKQTAHQLITLYTLTCWILDFSSESNGYGFPFDRPYFCFYKRLEKARFTLNAMGSALQIDPYTVELRHLLDMLLGDDLLRKFVTNLEKKIAHFDQLRQALRIALPEEKKGLNDDGLKADIRTIKAKVTDFVESKEFKELAKKNTDYHSMQKQIEKYWDKLFADPIKVTTQNGETISIQPQRTNNILERFFREIHRNNCKKSGNSSLKRELQIMLAETPLVKNLQNPNYLKIILNEKATLAERFAEIDQTLVKEAMKQKAESPEDKVPSLMKAVIRDPQFSLIQLAG